MNSEELYLTDKKVLNIRDEVIVSFGPFRDLDKIHQLDELLFKHIPDEIGQYDGHEVNMDDTDGRLFAYGNNAEKLFKAMEPILRKFDFLQNANVQLRFFKEEDNFSEIEFKLNQA